jgi:endogenous inhibitor of DNA gyrase (YacG/DUF329 family)
MDKRMVVRCPNCGSLAERILSDCLPTGSHCPEKQVTQTECPACDYFMSTCWQNGRVLEAYAPGIQGKSSPCSVRHSSYLIVDQRTSPETAITRVRASSAMALVPNYYSQDKLRKATRKFLSSNLKRE